MVLTKALSSFPYIFYLHVSGLSIGRPVFTLQSYLVAQCDDVIPYEYHEAHEAHVLKYSETTLSCFNIIELTIVVRLRNCPSSASIVGARGHSNRAWHSRLSSIGHIRRWCQLISLLRA